MLSEQPFTHVIGQLLVKKSNTYFFFILNEFENCFTLVSNNKVFYKMSNIYASSISYLTYYVNTNVFKVLQCSFRDFSQDFQILFPPGQFKKDHGKKQQFSVKVLARF